MAVSQLFEYNRIILDKRVTQPDDINFICMCSVQVKNLYLIKLCIVYNSNCCSIISHYSN